MHSTYREVHSDDEGGKFTPRKKSKDKKEKVVQLEPVFFKVGDWIDEDEINQYRMKYREFRRGKAFGARGEIEKPRVTISDNVDTIVPPFIAKLASMLKNSMYSEYVGWSEDGKTVSVKKVAEFSSAILPKYFKHSNFTSFLRQLNMYGFHTAKQGRNWREFRNELFTRDKPSLYCRIKRKANPISVNSTKSQAKQNTSFASGSSTAIGNKNKKRKKNGTIATDEESSAAVQTLNTDVKKGATKIAKLEKRVSALEKTVKKLAAELQMVYTGIAPKFSPVQMMGAQNLRGKRRRNNSESSSMYTNSLNPMMRGMSNMSNMSQVSDDNANNVNRLRYHPSSGMFMAPNNSLMGNEDEDYDDNHDFADSFNFSN